MLTKTNYHEWSLLMKVKMQARQLWDAIEYGGLPYHDDQRTLEATIAGVPPEMGAPLADKATAKETWDSIAAARIGVDRVLRATLQRLCKEWENLTFRPGEQVEEIAWQMEKKGGDSSGSSSSSKEPRRRPRGGRKQKPKGECGDRGDDGQGEKVGSAGGER